MTLGEQELVASMLRSKAYIETIEEELLPDDTLDLLQGTRKGKHSIKNFDHIVGISDLQTR